MKNLLLLIGLLGGAVAAPAYANTYYVRSDGGTPAQCTGLSDAAYPGSGSAQNCAWHHPFDALPPQGDGGTPAILLTGGDTLIIGSGSYEMGAGADAAKVFPACKAGWAWDCFMTAVPSGTAAQPTQILGKGWDTGCQAAPELWGSEHSAKVVNLAGSSNVKVACLEITDHSACVESYMRGNDPNTCNRSSAPFGPWASHGIYAKDSSNVTLQDLNIHGMANRGIQAGRLNNWTVKNVKIIANGWGGWDGDLGEPAGSSNSGQMLFQNLEVGYSGCGETYPDKQPYGCWGQQEGGYGDGLGTNKTSGNWVFQNSYFHDNTQDGLDLLYADTTATITVQQTLAERNAGNQIKVAGSPTVENSVIDGNCSALQGSGRISTGDLCRAQGNALVLSVQPGLKGLVRYNTIASEGDCLVLAINGDNTSSVALQNNALIGKPNFLKQGSQQSCMFYWDSGPSSWPVTYTANLTYQVKDNYCPPGAGNLCNVDPQLTDASLATFDAQPKSTSPLIDKASTSVPAVTTDFLSKQRPVGAGNDIGAIEYGSASGGGTPPPPPDSTDTQIIFRGTFEAP